MKKILTFFLIITAIMYIYIFTYDKKIYYLSISNIQSDTLPTNVAKYFEKKKLLEKHIYEFSDENNRIIDFINIINSNSEIESDKKKVSIKNALVKADVITISLKEDSITTFDNVKSSIEFREDVLTLLTKIREYSKEDIYFTSIPYGKSNNILYKLNIDKINSEIEEICKELNITFLESTNNKEILEIVKSKTIEED